LEEIPRDKGTYILIIKCPKNVSFKVGSLGTIMLKNWDVYVYVGSAFNKGGLASRVSRHLKYHDKKTFWHIDYVLNANTGCRIVTVIIIPRRKVEHVIAKYFSTMFKYVPKFGSTDCKCPSHFFVMEHIGLEEVMKNINKVLTSLKLSFKVLKCSEV